LRKTLFADLTGVRALAGALGAQVVLGVRAGMVEVVFVVERYLVDGRQLTSHESAAMPTPLIWGSVIA
jgi:hypothetical protein